MDDRAQLLLAIIGRPVFRLARRSRPGVTLSPTVGSGVATPKSTVAG
jgi:hypothetical protein